jgi:hypothetical protein
LDPDPLVLNYSHRDLISGTGCRSKGSRRRGMRFLFWSVDQGSGGQDETGQKTQEPAAEKVTGARSRGGGSPELAKLGTPGVLGGRDRAGERGWTAGNSSKGLGRLIRARVGGLHDGGGSG